MVKKVKNQSLISLFWIKKTEVAIFRCRMGISRPGSGFAAQINDHVETGPVTVNFSRLLNQLLLAPKKGWFFRLREIVKWSFYWDRGNDVLKVKFLPGEFLSLFSKVRDFRWFLAVESFFKISSLFGHKGSKVTVYILQESVSFWIIAGCLLDTSRTYKFPLFLSRFIAK